MAVPAWLLRCVAIVAQCALGGECARDYQTCSTRSRLSRSQIQTLEAVHKKLAALRFDGIYSAFDGAMYRHLRFFENGNKVAFLLIGLDAEEVAKGLNEEFQARCGGTFQVDEQTVSFIITDKVLENATMWSSSIAVKYASIA